MSEVPQKGPKLSEPRAIVTEVASYGAMTDTFDRLKAALADRYAIEQEVGSGGMATVYLARDLKHDRHVAIKVLRPELAAAIGPERFIREIKITAQLNHPHILPLLDSGDAEGFLFYVMPYVEGESLRDRLNRDKQLSIEDSIKIASEVADALSSAHKHDVIHRDIKPENILLEEGHAVVADFGIVRVITAAGAERLTETGLAIGTPAYMSPEQASGEDQLDGRSDIYSLGCVLYEMLAGEPPHTGPSVQAIIARKLSEPVRRLRAVRESIPVAVEELTMKALSRVPADRFDTAAAMAGALANPTTLSTAAMQSIVVLPFESLSPDPENEYFADGLTDELIADLSKIQTLRVISRTSAMTLKGRERDVRSIGRELDVRYVLEGSVRRAGNNLRVTAQLIDAMNDAHLWAEKYTGTLDDVFDIQEKLSRTIVDALKLELTPEENRRIVERPIDDVRAYECYLRARLETWRWSKDGLDHALRLIQNGLDIVGDNELLYAAQGSVYIQYRQVGIDTSDANLRKADECVEKIVALNPDSHHGHRLSGQLYRIRGNVQAAVRRLKRALAADPNNADMLLDLSYAYSITGKGFAARPLVAKLIEVDPLIPLNQCMPGWLDALDGHFDTAIEPYHKMHAMDPDNPMALLFYTWVLISNGMNEETSKVIDASSSTVKRTLPGQMAMVLHFASKGEAQNAADAVSPELRAMVASASDDLFPRLLGQGYAMIDHKEEAVHWLTMAADRGFINYPFLATHDPLLQNLRGYTGFEHLLEVVKHRWETFEV